MRSRAARAIFVIRVVDTALIAVDVLKIARQIQTGYQAADRTRRKCEIREPVEAISGRSLYVIAKSYIQR